MRKPRHRGAASSPGWVAGLGSDPPACPQTPAPDHSPLRPLLSSTQQTGWVSPASASVPPGLIEQHHPCAPFLPHDTSIPYTWEHSCSSSSLSLSQVLRGYLTFLGLLYFSIQNTKICLLSLPLEMLQMNSLMALNVFPGTQAFSYLFLCSLV